MALYKNGDLLQFSTHANFDKTHSPGAPAPDAGIYRCVSCGDEISIASGHSLPSQNHHQHVSLGAILWQLVVCAVSST
jgi:hypothetical protein